MKKIKNFFKTSTVYFFGKILASLITFLLLPIYTNKISTADYGYYDLSISIVATIVPILFLEIWSGILRFSLSSNDNKKVNVVSTATIMSFFSFILLFVVWFVCLGINRIDFLIYLFLYAIFYSLTLVFSSVSRAFGYNKEFASSGVIGSLIGSGVGLLSLFVFKMGVASLFISLIVNYFLQSIFLFFTIKFWKIFSFKKFDKDIFVMLVKFSWPLALNTILHYLNNSFNKVIITSYLGLDSLGVYSASIKFISIVTVVVSIFQLSWQELAFSLKTKQDKSTVYNYGMEIFSIVSAILGVLILPGIKLIFPYFIGENYRSSFSIIPVYYFSTYFIIVNIFLNEIVTAEDKNHYKVLSKILSIIFSLGFLFLFVKKLELYALVISVCISSIVEFVFLTILTVKTAKFKISVKPLIFYCILYSIAVLFYYKFSNILNILFICLACVLSMALILYFWKTKYKDIFKSMKKQDEQVE